MKKLTVLLMCVCCVFTAQAQKQFTLNSPGGNLQTTITIGDQLTYDITCDGRQILAPSPIAMSLDNGEVWGEKAKLSGTSRKSVDRMVSSPFYRANELRDHYPWIPAKGSVGASGDLAPPLLVGLKSLSMCWMRLLTISSRLMRLLPCLM